MTKYIFLKGKVSYIVDKENINLYGLANHIGPYMLIFPANHEKYLEQIQTRLDIRIDYLH